MSKIQRQTLLTSIMPWKVLNSHREISASVKNVKEAIAAFDDIVPSYLRSTAKYWGKAVFPVLLLCFVLQAVLLTGAMTFAFKGDHSIGFLSEQLTFARVLVSLSNIEEMEEQTVQAPADSKRLAPLLVSNIGVVVQSFIVAVIQIGMVYVFTGARYVAGLVNKTITFWRQPAEWPEYKGCTQ